MVTESAVVSLVGGACSGLVCTVLFQPLDFIKTQLQANNVAARSSFCSPRAQLYKGIVERAWWIGLRPSLAKTIPGVACYFATLTKMKALFGSNHMSPTTAVLIGALSRTITVIFVQPLALIKTRNESGQFGYKSINGAVRSIVVEENLRALYRGLSATIVRDAPFSGIYLAFYSHLKDVTFAGSENPLCTTVSGLAAASMAAFLTHPADVIKTRVQIQKQSPQHFQFVRVLVTIHKESGIAGFYYGFVPRLARRTLVTATAWLIYEEVKKRSDMLPGVNATTSS